MKRVALVVLMLLSGAVALDAHDPSAAPITWNREISRIVYERCASCHREGGASFSLMTFQDAQPHASAIKDSVLQRNPSDGFQTAGLPGIFFLGAGRPAIVGSVLR